MHAIFVPTKTCSIDHVLVHSWWFSTAIYDDPLSLQNNHQNHNVSKTIILEESIYLLTNSTERANQLHCRRNAKNQLNWGLMMCMVQPPTSYSQYIFRSFSYLKGQSLSDSALWTLHASRLDTYELFERSQLLIPWHCWWTKSCTTWDG